MVGVVGQCSGIRASLEKMLIQPEKSEGLGERARDLRTATRRWHIDEIGQGRQMWGRACAEALRSKQIIRRLETVKSRALESRGLLGGASELVSKSQTSEGHFILGTVGRLGRL